MCIDNVPSQLLSIRWWTVTSCCQIHELPWGYWWIGNISNNQVGILSVFTAIFICIKCMIKYTKVSWKKLMSSFLLSQQHIHTGFTFIYNKCIHTYMCVSNKNTFLHFFKITNISHLFRCFLREKIRNVCTSVIMTIRYWHTNIQKYAYWRNRRLT